MTDALPDRDQMYAEFCVSFKADLILLNAQLEQVCSDAAVEFQPAEWDEAYAAALFDKCVWQVITDHLASQ